MHPQHVYNRPPPFPLPDRQSGGVESVTRLANKFASSAAVTGPGSPAQAVRGADIRSECHGEYDLILPGAPLECRAPLPRARVRDMWSGCSARYAIGLRPSAQ